MFACDWAMKTTVLPQLGPKVCVCRPKLPPHPPHPSLVSCTRRLTVVGSAPEDGAAGDCVSTYIQQFMHNFTQIKIAVVVMVQYWFTTWCGAVLVFVWLICVGVCMSEDKGSGKIIIKKKKKRKKGQTLWQPYHSHSPLKLLG